MGTLTYPTELWLLPERDGSISAWCPDLDAWTAGATEREAALMGIDAVRQTLIAKHQYGDPIPEPFSAVYEKPEVGERVFCVIEWDPDEPEDEWVSAREAAESLCITRQGVSNLVRRGVLRSKKVGSALMISTEDIHKRLEAQSKKATAKA